VHPPWPCLHVLWLKPNPRQAESSRDPREVFGAHPLRKKAQKHGPSQQKRSAERAGVDWRVRGSARFFPTRRGRRGLHARGATWEARAPNPPEPAARVAAALARPRPRAHYILAPPRITGDHVDTLPPTTGYLLRALLTISSFRSPLCLAPRCFLQIVVFPQWTSVKLCLA
jgi:hypothetical protein